jgi:hypothetical protein
MDLVALYFLGQEGLACWKYSPELTMLTYSSTHT